MFILRAGVIDPDHRGPVVALVTYLGPEDFGYIDKHERVCQMIPTCFRGDPFHVCHSLPRSGRGENAGYTRVAYGGQRGQGPAGARGQPDGVRARPRPNEEDPEWERGCGPNDGFYTLPYKGSNDEPLEKQATIPESEEVRDEGTADAAATAQPAANPAYPVGSLEGGSAPPL